MEYPNTVYVEKKSGGFWRFVKVALVVAAVAYVGVKVYQKYFKKEELALDSDEELDAALDTELEPLELDVSDDFSEETFEASADAVIANAEDLDAATEEA